MFIRLGLTCARRALVEKIYGNPRAAAAHIAARTVRRFLEHWGDDLDLIVLVVDSAADARIYEATLRLYLPRSAAEERQ